MSVKHIDRAVIRSGATRMVLEKTDRILGQDKVRVVMADPNSPTPMMEAPAWTDGRIITLNPEMEPLKTAVRTGFTPKTMAIATALNYHELAHCMFTPRMDSRLVKKVANAGMFMSLNILEDQAAETRFVKMYEPARHYFTALVSNYMMENDDFLAANYPLVSGRLFLPQGLRDRFKNLYRNPQHLDTIDALVTEYKTLVSPKDDVRMFEVIAEFHKLLQDAPPNPGDLGTPHDNIVEGVPDYKKSKELTGEEEFVNTEGATDEEAETGKGKGDEGEEDEGKGNSSEGDDEAGGDEANSADASDDSDADGGSAQPLNREKPKQQPRKPSRQDKEDAKKQLDQLIEETVQQMSKELDERIDSVREEEQNYEVEKTPETTPNFIDVTSEQYSIVNQCVDAFREVRVQNNPGWHVHQRTGKLDHRRYAQALQGSDRVFRRWKEGVNDALDFEVVFLLDQSGSMNGRIKTASIALWVLKRTFEEEDGTVTVLGFSSDLTLLSQRGDRASQAVIPHYRTHGSTFVNDALSEARRILNISRKPLKLCVVISDGGFHDHDRAVKAMRQVGAPTLVLGIDMDVSDWTDTPNVIHTQTIKDPLEMVPVVRNLALRLSEEHIQRKG